MDLNDNLINVYDSYKFSNGRIVAFLKSRAGRLPNQTILIDRAGCRWAIKQYLRVTGSIETYKKPEAEEAQNIFQHLLEVINRINKPIKGLKTKRIHSL